MIHGHIANVPVVSIQKSWWQRNCMLICLLFSWTSCTWTRCMWQQSSPVAEICKYLRKLSMPAEFKKRNLALLQKMTCISPRSCLFVSEQQNQWQRELGWRLFHSLETNWNTVGVKLRARHTLSSCYWKHLTCGPSVYIQMSLSPSFTGTLMTTVKFSSLILFVTLKVWKKRFQLLGKRVWMSGLSILIISGILKYCLLPLIVELPSARYCSQRWNCCSSVCWMEKNKI